MTIKTKIKDNVHFSHVDLVLHEMLIAVDIENLSNKVEIIEKYGSFKKYSTYIQ